MVLSLPRFRSCERARSTGIPLGKTLQRREPDQSLTKLSIEEEDPAENPGTRAEE
jgi:hypothetical protein